MIGLLPRAVDVSSCLHCSTENFSDYQHSKIIWYILCASSVNIQFMTSIASLLDLKIVHNYRNNTRTNAIEIDFVNKGF